MGLMLDLAPPPGSWEVVAKHSHTTNVVRLSTCDRVLAVILRL